jgi:hypothetical protein
MTANQAARDPLGRIVLGAVPKAMLGDVAV